MSEFSIRSDSVDVEEIMRQIRARIAEKRGVDYTEQEIQELASARLDQFFDPQKVRSDLLEEIRRVHMDPNIELGEDTLFGSHRPWLRRVRRLLRPVLKLFINTTPLVHAAMVRNGDLFAELVHNLVVETTRLNLEIKNLKMRVESLSSRLDFDERRARALEGVVEYKATPAAAPSGPAAKEQEAAEPEAGGVARSRRRRRRRGRRGAVQRPGMDEAAAETTGKEQDGEMEAGTEVPSQESGETRSVGRPIAAESRVEPASGGDGHAEASPRPAGGGSEPGERSGS